VRTGSDGNDSDDDAAGPPAGDGALPARLGGVVSWDCNVLGAPAVSEVRVRVLVGEDGHARSVRPLRNNVGADVLRAAMPCALRHRYIAGTDSGGNRIASWTQPFRIVVTGL
jgi:hypothetical protein